MTAAENEDDSDSDTDTEDKGKHSFIQNFGHKVCVIFIWCIICNQIKSEILEWHVINFLEEETAQYGLELAELTSEISIKQKLIEELERSQKRIQLMRQHYEDKLHQLQERIRATQEERDTVLASFSE